MSEQQDEEPAEGVGHFQRIQGLALLGMAALVAVLQLLFDFAGLGWLLVGAMAAFGALRIATVPLHTQAVRWAMGKREERC